MLTTDNAAPETLQPIDPELFRDVLGSVAAPVSVVTTLEGDTACGATVTAFCSLSLAPPLVLVSLHRHSRLLSAIRVSGRFGINVLAHGQEALATGFARPQPDKFEGVQWCPAGGIPRLAGTQAWLGCRLYRLMNCGDHVVVTGLVIHAEVRNVAPLLYRRRKFGTVDGAIGTDA